MNIYGLLGFIISIIATVIIFYITVNGILLYRQNPKDKFLIHYVLTTSTFGFSVFLYSWTPFLIKGQEFLAEITLGGSLILIQIGAVFYIQYLHRIYPEDSWFPKLFYFATGGGFLSLFNEPWVIFFIEGKGYCQDISIQLLVPLLLQGGCIFLTLFQAFSVIKKRIDQEIILTQQTQQEFISKEGTEESPKQRTKNLFEKKKRLNLIIISWIIGFLLLFLGLIFPGHSNFHLDSLGAVVIFLPQAYVFTKDKDLIVSLSVHKAKKSVYRLQKSLYKLQRRFPDQNLKVEMGSILKFIEKADSLLYFEEGKTR